jgi:hypothetical protein
MPHDTGIPGGLALEMFQVLRNVPGQFIAFADDAFLGHADDNDDGLFVHVSPKTCQLVPSNDGVLAGR